MRKLTTIALLLLLITPCLKAQRKEMSQARSYIKSGKDFDKAEKLMTDLLKKDSANRINPKIYLLLYQAQKKQYETGNEQLYLKQKYDTAALFNTTKRMFATLESMDSIDAVPDKRGRAKLEYRKKHAAELAQYRANLYYGGSYNFRKKDYATAFDFFDAYIDCAKQPLFTDYDYAHKDTLMASAAYWATACGRLAKSVEKTLRHADLAKEDTAHLRFTLRSIAEAYSESKNDSDYLSTIRYGFNRYPLFPFFFPRLVDYYAKHNQLDSALAVTDKALQSDGKNELFLFAKSTTLLNMKRYDECIAVSDSLISVNDSLPDAYLNAGMACLNNALELESKPNARFNKSNITAVYAKAKPYMEMYRKLMPNEKDKWAPGLYRIYLNLNLGRQFEEIDKIIMSK